jgi:alpha-glucosidase
MISKIFFLLFAVLILPAGEIVSQDLSIQSPNRKIEVKISLKDSLTYSVFYNSSEIIAPSKISLTIDNQTEPVENPALEKIVRDSTNETIYPFIREKKSKIENHFNQLKMFFKKNFGITFRVFDDAIAYRFFTDINHKIKINNEEANFRFAEDYNIYVPIIHCRDNVDCFHTSYEENYSYLKLSEFKSDSLAFMPVVVDIPNKLKIGVTEADLYDYPGMYISNKKNGSTTIIGKFPAFPIEEKIFGGEFKQLLVTKRANYLAETNGKREFPWRIMFFAENDADLLSSEIVYKLSEKNDSTDFSWLKPGKSTEEWIISRNLYGVDFKTGINTDTYKFYIDFAAKFHLEYVMLDAGWSVNNDLLKVVPELDMHELLEYAKEKEVGIILWCLALSMKNEMEPALDQFKKWGVKGILVDFMDRDDQAMVNFYEKVLREAAKRKLFVNFHGAYKPTGIRRKYPNLLTRESVLGHEYNMWSTRVTPEHDINIAFIRNFAGPMDYEGGSMQNAQKENFRAIFGRPMSQGTRTHTLAQYVIYASPLQYLGGNPSDYLREPEFTNILAGLPTTWDDTKVIKAKISNYIVIARKHQNDWFAAAMTDWTPRTFEIDLDFLNGGNYNALICEDGVNADKYGNDYKIINSTVSKNQKIKIHMAPGGGWFAHFSKKD